MAIVRIHSLKSLSKAILGDGFIQRSFAVPQSSNHFQVSCHVSIYVEKIYGITSIKQFILLQDIIKFEIFTWIHFTGTDHFTFTYFDMTVCEIKFSHSRLVYSVSEEKCDVHCAWLTTFWNTLPFCFRCSHERDHCSWANWNTSRCHWYRAKSNVLKTFCIVNNYVFKCIRPITWNKFILYCFIPFRLH